MSLDRPEQFVTVMSGVAGWSAAPSGNVPKATCEVEISRQAADDGTVTWAATAPVSVLGAGVGPGPASWTSFTWAPRFVNVSITNPFHSVGGSKASWPFVSPALTVDLRT